MDIRRRQKAFHPNAIRINMNFGPKIFGFKRISRDKKQSITCVTNLSSVTQKIKIKKNNQKIRNLMGSKIQIKNNQFVFLKPFETLWISNI